MHNTACAKQNLSSCSYGRTRLYGTSFYFLSNVRKAVGIAGPYAALFRTGAI